MIETPVAVVTGASGYLGSRICSTLELRGWEVVRLAHASSSDGERAYAYELDARVTTEVRSVLESTDVLVHAAYDLGLTRAADIRRVNVEGSRRLLEVASQAGVRRILVLSSMSAFEGTTQLYGRAKLEIEAITQGFGGCAVRPGLVYAGDSGGMAGALAKLATLPVVPLIAGNPKIYTVREDDLMTAVGAMAATDELEAAVVSVAGPVPVALRDMLTMFAAQAGNRCRFVPFPWQPIYGILRTAEFVGLRLPFRADSLLGLVHSAPQLTNPDVLVRLGVSMRAFDHASVDG